MIGVENGLGYVVVGVVLAAAHPVAAALPAPPTVSAPAPVVAAQVVAVAPAPPRPAPRPVTVASTPRVNPCPVQSWQYGTWSPTHPVAAHSNPGQPSDYIYGYIPPGAWVSGCIRPDGWAAVTGYGWVKVSELT